MAKESFPQASEKKILPLYSDGGRPVGPLGEGARRVKPGEKAGTTFFVCLPDGRRKGVTKIQVSEEACRKGSEKKYGMEITVRGDRRALFGHSPNSTLLEGGYDLNPRTASTTLERRERRGWGLRRRELLKNQ